MSDAPVEVVDTRGMRCPWPALRLARALRTGGGGVIELLADDPAAERECSAVAAAAGRAFEVVEAGRFRLGINISFTAGP